MDLSLLRDDSIGAEMLADVSDVVNGFQTTFRTITMPDTLATGLGTFGEVCVEDAFAELCGQDDYDQDADYLLVTSKRLEDNFFGWRAGNLSVFSACSWEYYTRVPLKTGLLYGVVGSLIWLQHGGHKFHEETRGCPFDFVGFKPDIDRGIRAGRLCDECLSALRSVVPTKELEVLLDLLGLVSVIANSGRIPTFARMVQGEFAPLPFVPSSTEGYNPSRETISQLEREYQELQASRGEGHSANQRGAALEAFCTTLFSAVEGLEHYRSNARLRECEVDISFSVASQTSDLHRSLGPVVFVECKNRAEPAGVADLSHHILNLLDHKLQAGLFVSVAGISGYSAANAQVRDAMAKIVSAYRQHGVLVIPFVGEDIEAVRNGMNLYRLLSKKRLEIIHQ